MKQQQVGFGVAGIVALFMLHNLGMLGETTAAAALAVAITGGCVWLVIAELRHALPAAAVVLVALVTAVVVMVPVAGNMMLGSPLHTAMMRHGERLEVPESVAGKVRVLVHGDLPAGAVDVKYRLEGADSPISGELERASGKARAGRKSVKTWRVHDTTLTTVELQPHQVLTLHVSGMPELPLSVSIYRQWWPLIYELPLAALLLLTLVVVSLRKQLSVALVPTAAAAVAYAVMAHEWVTPSAAFRPEMGALLVAALIGTALHALWRQRSGLSPGQQA